MYLALILRQESIAAAKKGRQPTYIAVRTIFSSVVSLRSITGRSFKFDPGAKEVDRAKRIKAWRDWWKKSADDFIGRV